MVKKPRLLAAVLLILLSVPGISAETNELAKEYSKMMLINTILPGTAQIKQGKTAEGILYLTSIPIGLAGQIMALYYFYQHGEEGLTFGLEAKEGEHYLSGFNENNDFSTNQYLLYGGMTLSLYSSLLSSYSSYAAHRDFSDRYFQNPVRRGKESLLDLITAPYKPENFFSSDVFPFFPITIIGSLQGKDIGRMAGFFQREEVDFWGYKMHPAAGFCLNTLFSFLLVTANATLEEIMYRGLSLEKSGTAASSFSFGAAHLPNMLMPGASIESTVLQSIFATLMGFYAGNITEKNGYNIEKAVTIHFWHNILAFTLNYLATPEQTPGLSLRIQIRQ